MSLHIPVLTNVDISLEICYSLFNGNKELVLDLSNVRTNSFIFPLFKTEIDDYNFSINLLANEIFAASFPYAEHVDNISSYQNVNGANKIRSEDSEKNGNF